MDTSPPDKDAEALWQQALTVLEARLNNVPAYGVVSTLSLIEADTSRFVLGAQNTYMLMNIKQKYMEPLQSAIEEAVGHPIEVILSVVKNKEAPVSNHEPYRIEARPRMNHTERSQTTNLNPRYIFDNFVVGSHSKFAHASAWRVAESPGQAYNPLFIYGGVGLGKTHLMQAIGNQMLQHHERFKITYISSERFTNELINAVKDGTTLDFKNRYRNSDLLLIDDIQFIGGKEMTQEEFFHTFNDLHEAGKQIVITSDRPPNELSTLENRLRSRFQMGLICDIQPPDFETRIAILKKKAEMDELGTPDEVLHFIARAYKSNVRELEGALVKLMAYTSMTGTSPSVLMAQSVLGQVPERDVNTDVIQEVTADYFELKISDIKGKSRTKSINLARQIAIYLCRELTDLSFPKIAEHFGGRDHTTIMHAYERIRELILEDSKTESMVNALLQRLR